MTTPTPAGSASPLHGAGQWFDPTTVQFLEIPLTRGLSAKVSPEDYPALSKFKWWAKPSGNTAYAIRAKDRARMHNLILSPPHGHVADHRNGDGLDNTRTNLRLATRLENNFNRQHQRDSLSRFKGVTWRKTERRWRAQICISGRRIVLGDFREEEKAAHLYDFVAAQFFGDFARLNFPEAPR